MNFDYIKYREIEEIIKKAGKSTKIVAISKNHPKSSVVEAFEHGVEIFGENRVQEAKNKFENLKKQHNQIKLHLTGPLQSNKVKEAIPLFNVFHTLDREKIAKEFSKYKEQLNKKEIFVQVNTGDEITKSGISPKDLSSFLKFCEFDMGLNINGLMCIPPIDDKPDIHFKILKSLALKNNLNKLSIGMSGDFEKALEFSPSYIRLGTILFGNRN